MEVVEISLAGYGSLNRTTMELVNLVGTCHYTGGSLLSTAMDFMILVGKCH